MKKTLLVLIIFSLFVVIFACTKQSSEEVEQARKIVVDYYTSLNNKDYEMMYSLISEGFKQLEPTAKNFEVFEKEMSKFFNTAESINVKSTEIKSASNNEVVVDYVAEIALLNNNTQELKSSFTIKKKTEGWKLIHPYGNFKDED